MARLVDRALKEFSSSTGISESIVNVHIDLPSSSFHAVTVINSDTWQEVDYDASVVRQMNERSTLPPEQASLQQAISVPVVRSTSESTLPPRPPVADSQIPASAEEPAPTERIKISDRVIREMIDTAIEKCGGYNEFSKSYSKSFSLYLRDAGGQMAFQEMLSVLILGPSLFMFVFRADLDLKQKFTVEYRVSANETLNCNVSSITTEESLLQCLASVYAMDTGKTDVKTHKPVVFIVGTHKDKLGPSAGEKISEINEHLDSLIDSSDCFRDLVQYADRAKGQVMFTVDNTSESDEDFKLIRSRIYVLVIERSEFTIEYPTSYLLFSLVLQNETRGVLTFDECKSIAREYGIPGDQVSHLLQFLHFRVGVIQYFDVEGVIMVKPQVLLKKVTSLVKRTFSYKSLMPGEERDLRKGILTASMIKNIVKDDDISSEKLIQLLTRLHIITPFPHLNEQEKEQEKKYFIPCVLKHAHESSDGDEEAVQASVLPLSVQFECGHCPNGLFGVLITYLMTTETLDGTINFTLIPDKIFRDQVSFEVHCAAEQDEMALKEFSSHLEIHFFPCSSEDRDVSLNEVCNDVRKVVESSISKSLEYLRYKVKPITCLKCDACQEFHPVKTGLRIRKMYCKRNRTTSPIPKLGRCWFTEGQLFSALCMHEYYTFFVVQMLMHLVPPAFQASFKVRDLYT
jgi:hypothetical protein